VDTPRSDHDVPACLATHRKAIERCTTTRSAAFGPRYMRREREAARLTGATLVDLSAVTCPTDPCPPVIGSMLVYRDHHHLTATFARSLVAELEAALPVVGDRRGPYGIESVERVQADPCQPWRADAPSTTPNRT